MKAKDIIKKLTEAGFINKGGKNHDKLVHPDGRITVIHRHQGDIPTGTLKAIEKQTKVKFGMGESSPLPKKGDVLDVIPCNHS